MTRSVAGLIAIACAIGLAAWFWFHDSPRHRADVEQSPQIADRGDEMSGDESRSRGFRRGAARDSDEEMPEHTSGFNAEGESSPGRNGRSRESRPNLRRSRGSDATTSEDDAERSGKLLGRVLDSSGHPVVGALVVARPLDGQDERVTEYDGFTEPGGYFLIPGLRPGDYQVQAKSPYSDTKSRPVRVRTGPESIDLLIPDISTVRVFGVVHDRDSLPVSGAKVHAALPNLPAVITDANGRYEFNVHVQSDRSTTVRFEHDQFRSHREAIPGNLELAEFELSVTLERLDRTVTVGGMLLDEQGQPVPGKRVDLRGSASRYRAISDEGGIFLFPEVEGGKTYRLSVPSGDAYKRYSRDSFRVPQEDLLDVAIELTSRGQGEIFGMVTDRQGRPLPGFEMRVSVDHFNESVRTDDHGQFMVDQVPAGRVRLSTSSQPRFVTSGAQLQSGQTLELHAEVDLGGNAMEGRVLDELGMPVGNARVGLSWVSRAGGITHESLRQSITDDEGRFRFSGFGPGERTLIVNADGFEPARITVSADASPVIKLTPGS